VTEYRTDEERAAYDPGPCPSCGGALVVEWVEIPTIADLEPYPAVPGPVTCRRGCGDRTA
jgi:hypothetical protein